MTLKCNKGWAIAVAALILSLPISAMAQTKHPAEERGVKSTIGGDTVSTSIKFVNKSQQVIKVYWLDYKGRRVLYGTPKPGEALPIQTFLTHPWVITDGDDNAQSIYFPDGQPRVIEIL
jgi:von Hippel-Lindau disease tumor supressor